MLNRTSSFTSTSQSSKGKNSTSIGAAGGGPSELPSSSSSSSLHSHLLLNSHSSLASISSYVSSTSTSSSSSSEFNRNKHPKEWDIFDVLGAFFKSIHTATLQDVLSAVLNHEQVYGQQLVEKSVFQQVLHYSEKADLLTHWMTEADMIDLFCYLPGQWNPPSSLLNPSHEDSLPTHPLLLPPSSFEENQALVNVHKVESMEELGVKSKEKSFARLPAPSEFKNQIDFVTTAAAAAETTVPPLTSSTPNLQTSSTSSLLPLPPLESTSSLPTLLNPPLPILTTPHSHPHDMPSSLQTTASEQGDLSCFMGISGIPPLLHPLKGSLLPSSSQPLLTPPMEKTVLTHTLPSHPTDLPLNTTRSSSPPPFLPSQANDTSSSTTSSSAMASPSPTSLVQDHVQKWTTALSTRAPPSPPPPPPPPRWMASSSHRVLPPSRKTTTTVSSNPSATCSVTPPSQSGTLTENPMTTTTTTTTETPSSSIPSLPQPTGTPTPVEVPPLVVPSSLCTTTTATTTTAMITTTSPSNLPHPSLPSTPERPSPPFTSMDEGDRPPLTPPLTGPNPNPQPTPFLPSVVPEPSTSLTLSTSFPSTRPMDPPPEEEEEDLEVQTDDTDHVGVPWTLEACHARIQYLEAQEKVYHEHAATLADTAQTLTVALKLHQQRYAQWQAQVQSSFHSYDNENDEEEEEKEEEKEDFNEEETSSMPWSGSHASQNEEPPKEVEDTKPREPPKKKTSKRRLPLFTSSPWDFPLNRIDIGIQTDPPLSDEVEDEKKKSLTQTSGLLDGPTFPHVHTDPPTSPSLSLVNKPEVPWVHALPPNTLPDPTPPSSRARARARSCPCPCPFRSRKKPCPPTLSSPDPPSTRFVTFFRSTLTQVSPCWFMYTLFTTVFSFTVLLLMVGVSEWTVLVPDNGSISMMEDLWRTSFSPNPPNAPPVPPFHSFSPITPSSSSSSPFWDITPLMDIQSGGGGGGGWVDGCPSSSSRAMCREDGKKTKGDGDEGRSGGASWLPWTWTVFPFQKQAHEEGHEWRRERGLMEGWDLHRPY